jgi:hypothetical protein
MASYIQALVVRFNNDTFVDDPTVTRVSGANITTGIGSTKAVPCPDSVSGGVIDGDYWAKPINEGTVSDFLFVPYNVNESISSQPTEDSFAVVRISSRFTRDVWWVVGTSTQYLASCAVCCSDSPVAMPDATDLPVEAGCQVMCNQFSNGLYFATLGLPILIGNERYYPFGYFNGEALPTATGLGYATTGDLLTFLNTADTGWAAVGTWTVSNGALIVQQTDGPGTDILCAAVSAINPSA